MIFSKYINFYYRIYFSEVIFFFDSLENLWLLTNLL